MTDIPPPPDRATVRANAAAEKARAKAMRPWYKKKRYIIPLVLLVLIVGAALAGGGDDDDVASTNTTSGARSDFSSNDKNPPAADVKITRCAKEEFGGVTVELEVINHSSKTSDYTISVGVEEADGTKIGDGFATTNNVKPDQKARVEGFTDVSDPPAGFKCTLEEVERFES